MQGAILDQIWSGTIERKDLSEMSEIAQMLSSLLVAPVACFSSDTVDVRRKPFAWVASQEVFPGASLADVLYEELDVEVSEDTVIYLEPASLREANTVPGDAMSDAICKLLANLANTRGEKAPLTPRSRRAKRRIGSQFATLENMAPQAMMQ